MSGIRQGEWGGSFRPSQWPLSVEWARGLGAVGLLARPARLSCPPEVSLLCCWGLGPGLPLPWTLCPAELGAPDQNGGGREAWTEEGTGQKAPEGEPGEDRVKDTGVQARQHSPRHSPATPMTDRSPCQLPLRGCTLTHTDPRTPLFTRMYQAPVQALSMAPQGLWERFYNFC